MSNRTTRKRREVRELEPRRHVTARRLREVRKRNGWTQTEAATFCGLHQSQIAHFEGGRAPSADNLLKLAVGLRVTADWLLGRNLKALG